MKWGIWILGVVLMGSVSALNFGEVFGDNSGPATYMEQDGTVRELTCVEVKQLVIDETGWDQIYCADNETTDLIFIQGNFKYSTNRGNSHNIYYEDVPEEIPEFGMIAIVLALFGAGLIFVMNRR